MSVYSFPYNDLTINWYQWSNYQLIQLLRKVTVAVLLMHSCMETDTQSSRFTVNHESFKIRFIVSNSLSPISVENEPIRLQYPSIRLQYHRYSIILHIFGLHQYMTHFQWFHYCTSVFSLLLQYFYRNVYLLYM